MRMGQWQPGTRVLVGPVDLWNSEIPDQVIRDLFLAMASLPQHRFRIVTENAYRMEQWFGTTAAAELEAWMADCEIPWPLPWVALGILVHDQESLEDRLGGLLGSPASERIVVINGHKNHIDLTDVGCPAGIYEASQVSSCSLCDGEREFCRDGRYNALVDGITEVVLCDRNLDNVTAIMADNIEDQCSMHMVHTIRIHR